MTRNQFNIDRRRFLAISGAFASIEFDGSAMADRVDDYASREPAEPLLTHAQRLPSPTGLAADSHVEFSLTRLDEDVAKLTSQMVSDADSYATVFAGRTATDVAFGLDDPRAVRGRLTDSGYETRGTFDGWPVFHRGTRTRHRMIAVADATAVVSVGPVYEAVANDVAETLTAVTGSPTPQVTDVERCAAILAHLGPGMHISVDMSPDSRRTTEGLEATGERYEVRDDATAVRTVALFDSPARARTASRDDLDSTPALQSRAATVDSVEYHGRAIVRDGVIPSSAFGAGPERPTE